MAALITRIPVLLTLTALLLPGTAHGQKPAPERERKSDPEAIQFLLDAEAKLYNPVREGLKTYSFKRPVRSELGDHGFEVFYFKAPDRYTFRLETLPTDPQAAALLAADMAEEHLRQLKAARTLGIYLGNFLTQHLDQYIVAFLVKQEGSTRIRCMAKPGTEAAKGYFARDYFFDGDGLITAVKIIDTQSNTMMWKFDLKELEGTPYRLIDRVELERVTPQGLNKTVQTFSYVELEGFHLISKSSQTHLLIQEGAEKVEYEAAVESLDLKVNQPMDDTVFQVQGK